MDFEEKTKKKKKTGQKTGQHDEHLLQSRRERKTESKAKLERQGDAKKHDKVTPRSTNKVRSWDH